MVATVLSMAVVVALSVMGLGFFGSVAFYELRSK